MSETIFALSSPPGKGGVAVIRVSGPSARAGLEQLASRADIIPRHAYYATLRDPVSRETIDRALVLFFAGPASFTGEDIAEYHVHGGMAVVRQLLAVLGRQSGYRAALPGEFTRRAFENGKLDLTAAEAVADLIDAETALQKQQALSQMGGALADLYQGWADRLTRALAHLEADLEFPDEDMPDGILPQLLPELAALAAEIDAHLQDNRRGERLRDGLHVAVIGAPNAGKSSLVNALAQRDVAIVSDQAGTTRDIIEVHLDLGGYPVILSDTAGLRPDQIGPPSLSGGQDAIEGEGIRRALARAESADIRLLLFDATALPDRDPHTAALADDTALTAFNKADAYQGSPPGEDPLMISARTGQGLEALGAALVEKAAALIGTRETPSLTRSRHRAALTGTLAALQRGQGAALPELTAEDMRLAVRHLGRLTGRVDVEDLLDVIFRDFCIGK